MIESVKAWIKSNKDRKRAKRAKREQQAAAILIGQIERALRIELYDWQRLYIITGIWQPPEGRQQGKTLAYILRTLLDKSKPLLLYECRTSHCLSLIYAN